MRVRFRAYCYGCRHGWRAGDNWHTAFASRRTRHRWQWEYVIHLDGYRLVQRGPFGTLDRAVESARRAWSNLEAVLGIACQVEPWGES